MKNLTAIIKIDGATTHKTYNDYKTKKAFKSDLIQNGYKVIAILTDKQIQEVLDLGTYEVDVTSEVQEYIRQCLY